MNHSPRATHDIPAKSPDGLFCLCKQISCIPKRTFLKIIYTQWDYFWHKQPFRWTNNICFEISLYLFGAKTIQFFTFHRFFLLPWNFYTCNQRFLFTTKLFYYLETFIWSKNKGYTSKSPPTLIKDCRYFWCTHREFTNLVNYYILTTKHFNLSLNICKHLTIIMYTPRKKLIQKAYRSY